MNDRYEPLASDWEKLLPMTLEIKVDGPLKRRIEDLAKEIAKEAPDLPPVAWGIVFLRGSCFFAWRFGGKEVSQPVSAKC